jgi:nicotinamidase-related amidase
MENKQDTSITIDPSTTALLLLHWQNDVAKPGGRNVHDMPERLKATQTLEKTQAVLKAAREKGMLIAYVNGAHRPGYPELAPSPKRSRIAQMLVDNKVMMKDTWGAEVVEELKPLDNEIIIDNYSTSAFCYTALDLILRNRRITDIVLSGIATNIVVESTAREGYNMCYCVYTLEDCCKSVTDDMHDWTISHILPSIGTVIDSKTFISAIQG